MDSITSHRNAKVKQVRSLRRRKSREESGLFVVEGIRAVGEAYEAGLVVAYVCYAPDLLTSPYAKELVSQWEQQGTPCYPTSSEVFEGLATREGPQGILAVAHQQWVDLNRLNGRNFPWGVVLDAPQDPGNVGAISRTLNAVGASGLILLGKRVDPYHPTAVRASMGALFWHPIVSAATPQFINWAKAESYHIYGTSAHGEVDYRELTKYNRPALLLMGSEREGLSADLLAICNPVIRLPMLGTVTSLNLAVATGVMLYAMLDP